MKEIDINSWKRSSHYKLFSSYANPTFKVEVRLDMTNFMDNKPDDDGFFIPFTYLLSQSINNFEGLRIRYVDGKVVVFDNVSPSYTVFLENENFAFQKTEFVNSYKQYSYQMKKDIAFAKEHALTESGENLYATNNRADLIYLSCLPWIDFTSTDNPLPYDDKMSMSIPRINWGKCVKENDGYKMTLSLTINHAYLDGYEASMMLCDLQERLNNCKEHFNK